MLLEREESCLLLVDVQEKLTPLTHEHEQLTASCLWLLQVAEELQVPILVSEQYPKGLGPTLPALREACPHAHTMEKMHFSCMADSACAALINKQSRPQVVVIGIETHVCVLQTAVDLFMDDRDVFVVADAVSSRNPRDTEHALLRMRDMGIQVVTKEMVLFEWLTCAGTDLFKRMSKQFL